MLKKRPSFVRVASLFALTALSSSVLAELVVENGYVRKPIPGRMMTAAFMDIKNTSETDIVVTEAKLEGAGSVEIHTHSHVDGVMRMRQIHELNVPAGGEKILQPGGLHLMVFGIKQLPEMPELTLCDNKGRCYVQKLSLRSLVK